MGNYKKTILSTVLFTLSALLVLSAIICVLLFFVFTKQCADFFYSLGRYNISANLYHKVYEKSGDIFYCHKALNLQIKLKNNSKIVEYYLEFISNDDYIQFMDELQKHNEQSTVGLLEMSSMLNEDNYLTNRFLASQMAVGSGEDAFEFALKKFADYEDFDLKNQGVYALNLFLSNDNYEDFTTVYDNFDKSLIECMQDYFDNGVSTFDSFKNSNDSLEKAYVIALSNRLILVGHNINEIYEKLDINPLLRTANFNLMHDMNETIKQLL